MEMMIKYYLLKVGGANMKVLVCPDYYSISIAVSVMKWFVRERWGSFRQVRIRLWRGFAKKMIMGNKVSLFVSFGVILYKNGTTYNMGKCVQKTASSFLIGMHFRIKQ